MILYSLRFSLFTVKISGASMWPRLVSGRWYLATNLLPPRVGDAIVFKNPRNPARIFVKQVTKKSREGYVVAGTLPEATSSEQIGIVGKRLVLGRIFAWPTCCTTTL